MTAAKKPVYSLFSFLPLKKINQVVIAAEMMAPRRMKHSWSKKRLAVVKRIMLDIDNLEDLELLLKLNEKPDLNEKKWQFMSFG